MSDDGSDLEDVDKEMFTGEETVETAIYPIDGSFKNLCSYFQPPAILSTSHKLSEEALSVLNATKSLLRTSTECLRFQIPGWLLPYDQHMHRLKTGTWREDAHVICHPSHYKALSMIPHCDPR
jgi:hypothetical protein